MAEIDLNVLTAALGASQAPELGEVVLQPPTGPISEGSPPPDPESTPATPIVMGSPVLVPALAYRFLYSQTRYIRLGYVLEWGSSPLGFETGEFWVLSDQAVVLEGPQDEGTPPAEILSPYALPTLTFAHTVHFSSPGSPGSSGNLTFGVADDPTLLGSGAGFGLTFQINVVAAPEFPKLRAFVLKKMPLLPFVGI